MKIYKMTATFGKLEHETISFQPGLNIIEAPNEWGKSTWCAFIVAMLYGIDTRERTKAGSIADKERYAPWSGNPMSGRMDLNWNGRDITLERRTKGRTVFGEFKAYETDTGLPVPELTAANCGQMLLGVEKEVFTRAGFIRMTDLPITQEEALRRRLNALVTTGDESDASDTLAQKLKDLKNRCRFNKTGLLPQAEAQEKELSERIGQLHALQEQAEHIGARQKELETQVKALENHKVALEYEAGRDYTQKLLEAEAARDRAQAKLQEAEAVCAGLPSQEETVQMLTKLSKLREEQDSLHAQAQLLPSQPQMPVSTPLFQGLSGADAVRQAQTDAAVYAQSSQSQDKHTLGILGMIALLAGIALGLIPNGICRGFGIVLLIAGILLCRIRFVDRKRAGDTVRALADKYAPLPPEQWVAAAEGYAQGQDAYALALEGYQTRRNDLENRLSALRQTVAQVTGGTSLSECRQKWDAIQAARATLAEAQREFHRAQELAQALRGSHKETPPPAFPDTLTLSAAETAQRLSDATVQLRQLQLRLGQCQGQTEALGQEEILQQQLSAVRARIARLEDTYEALTIAQQTLAAASNELQRRFAPRISKRAQTLFSKLTHNRYDRLLLEEDLSLSAGAQGEDTLRSCLWRSDGTVDQLYLALRLAVAEELTPDAPLVLDDALVRFDDKRLASAMEILRETAESKQVILFTCQSREKERML